VSQFGPGLAARLATAPHLSATAAYVVYRTYSHSKRADSGIVREQWPFPDRSVFLRSSCGFYRAICLQDHSRFPVIVHAEEFVAKPFW